LLAVHHAGAGAHTKHGEHTRDAVRHAEVELSIGSISELPVRQLLGRRVPGKTFSPDRLSDLDQPPDQQLQTAARRGPRQRMKGVDAIPGQTADQIELSDPVRLLPIEHPDQRFTDRVVVILLVVIEEDSLQMIERPGDAGEAGVEIGTQRALAEGVDGVLDQPVRQIDPLLAAGLRAEIGVEGGQSGGAAGEARIGFRPDLLHLRPQRLGDLADHCPGALRVITLQQRMPARHGQRLYDMKI